MSDQTAELEWRDTAVGAVPVSTKFDDPYYSLDNGLAETEHVFLDGNDLPNRFVDSFHVAELGFGTGLNFLAALQAFRNSGTAGKLLFTSFEAFPMTKTDLHRALSPYKTLDISALDADLAVPVEGDDFLLSVVVGDARQTLPAWVGCADAWFLDGFSPAKNPELWEPDLMRAVEQKTRAGGTFATYTAAGHVRRALAEAGFEVRRVPGFGRKRHMTTGRKTDAK